MSEITEAAGLEAQVQAAAAALQAERGRPPSACGSLRGC